MNRLLKPLSFALALLLVLALFPTPARAASGFAVDSNGYITPNDTADHSLTMSFYLKYGDERVNSSTPGLSNVTVSVQDPNQSVISGGTGLSQSLSADGLFTFTFNTRPDAPNGIYRMKFQVSYNNGQTATVSARYTIVNGVDTSTGGDDTGDSGEIYDPFQPQEEIDKSKLQTKYDITLVSKPAAQDKMDGTVDLRLYLAYQGNQDLNDAPISYIRRRSPTSASSPSSRRTPRTSPLNWTAAPTSRTLRT